MEQRTGEFTDENVRAWNQTIMRNKLELLVKEVNKESTEEKEIDLAEQVLESSQLALFNQKNEEKETNELEMVSGDKKW